MKKIFWLFFLVFQFVFSQEFEEPKHIKTIIFKNDNALMPFPIVQIGESFSLSFDDLNASETDYYYTITHCNYNWEPSNLLKSEYLGGFDDIRITDFKNSYGTLQPYTHYKLTLPNADTQFRLTGNYIITITDAQQNPIFSRRFIIYTNTAQVQISAHQTQNLSFIEEKQNIQLKISSKNTIFENPSETVKVVVFQNFNWNTLRKDIRPQYILGNDLIYKYDNETSFWGGNEYFYFENKEIRSSGGGVLSTIKNGNSFETTLLTNTIRSEKPYTYFPDINGQFKISSTQGNPENEAEYSWVTFSLEATNQILNNEIYVYGQFSENKINSNFLLKYNPEKHIFEGKILLKQGFYNYKFATKTKNEIDWNAFSGNHYQTENNYTAIVYYRPSGELYDRVIGMATLNTTLITRSF